jgi:hypothetical protein
MQLRVGTIFHPTFEKSILKPISFPPRNVFYFERNIFSKDLALSSGKINYLTTRCQYINGFEKVLATIGETGPFNETLEAVITSP